ncbi:methyl-accepting chemotaxis protein [Acuticoccus yangtzensis]|uniref:methyl-accepting chemotaxis protein n=1 Tax=Acuticoccus yangtzensis TaxID=1443441 RepID=UPI0009F864AB|nr:methyl-accepting chemotaxis protein [Acuticoccus yangtzensis]
MSVKLRIVAIVAVMGASLVMLTGLATYNLLNIRGSVANMAGDIDAERLLVDFESDLLYLNMAAAAVYEDVSRGKNPRMDPLSGAIAQVEEDLERMAARLAGFNLGIDARQPVEAVLAERRALIESIETTGTTGNYQIENARQSMAAASEVLKEIAGGLVAMAEEDLAYIVSEITSALIWTIGLPLVGILAGTGYSLWTATTQISRPLLSVRDRLRELEEGALNTPVDGTARNDELGSLAKSAEALRLHLIEVETMRATARKEREDRAVHQREAIERQIARLDQDVNSVVRSLSAAASQLSSSAGQLRNSAKQSTTQSDRVSHAAEETSSNVQAVASAAEELAASAQEIGAQVHQSTQISLEALNQAESANKVVEGLSGSAKKIGQVVDLIEDIASQTNLLALNATIEAARAGDAGKGFAVVAMEVKSLAEQTGSATKEISSQIQAVQADVDRVVHAIQSLKTSFTKANELASSVASAIEEQSAATGAIAQSVQQAAVSTQDVSSIIIDVSKAANDTGTGANDIVAASDELTTQADTLRTRMANFIASMRSDAA